VVDVVDVVDDVVVDSGIVVEVVVDVVVDDVVVDSGIVVDEVVVDEVVVDEVVVEEDVVVDEVVVESGIVVVVVVVPPQSSWSSEPLESPVPLKVDECIFDESSQQSSSEPLESPVPLKVDECIFDELSQLTTSVLEVLGAAVVVVATGGFSQLCCRYHVPSATLRPPVTPVTLGMMSPQVTPAALAPGYHTGPV
jgi:hypothetical protein